MRSSSLYFLEAIRISAGISATWLLGSGCPKAHLSCTHIAFGANFLLVTDKLAARELVRSVLDVR